MHGIILVIDYIFIQYQHTTMNHPHTLPSPPLFSPLPLPLLPPPTPPPLAITFDSNNTCDALLLYPSRSPLMARQILHNQ